MNSSLNRIKLVLLMPVFVWLSQASAQTPIEMPDMARGHTVCSIQGLNQDESKDNLDSSDPTAYEAYGKSAARTFKTTHFDVFLEISEFEDTTTITWHVDSLPDRKTLSENVAPLVRRQFGQYSLLMPKPVGTFGPGERQYISLTCRHVK